MVNLSLSIESGVASTVVLTLHGVRPKAEPSHGTANAASRRYFVTEDCLEQVLARILPEQCCCAGEFAGKSRGDWITLAFDDGLNSDYAVVLPALARRGLRGTFFVTTDHIGCDGFTNAAQLRKLASAGMEIASHGLTHRYLVSMPRAEAAREIAESRLRLEDILGVQIAAFAPVGGHYARWMLDVAAEAGYRVFATMIPGRSRNGGRPVLLRRNHVQAHHTVESILRLLSGDRRALVANRLRYSLLKVPKTLFGMQNYDRLKGLLLRAATGWATEGTAVKTGERDA